MSVTVRCQLFSGRRDPTWTLSPAQVTELRALIAALQGRTLLKPDAVAGALGYRGFLIHSDEIETLAPESSVLVHAGIIDQQRLTLNLVDDNNGVERWLLNSSGGVLPPGLKTRITKQLRFTNPVLPHGWKRRRSPLQKKRKKPRPVDPPSQACRPQYDPQPWNAAAHVGLNHCYNYATDVMTDHAALPGEGSGTACCSTDRSVTCTKVGAAAESDKLDSTTNTTPSNPPHAHFVALAVEPADTPGRDFHWYRRDCNGLWSHKVGNSPARDVDESGQTIVDPQSCDRGTYKVFCGFFTCDPAIVTIF
jgi:hypothetical protein